MVVGRTGEQWLEMGMRGENVEAGRVEDSFPTVQEEDHENVKSRSDDLAVFQQREI